MRSLFSHSSARGSSHREIPEIQVPKHPNEHNVCTVGTPGLWTHEQYIEKLAPGGFHLEQH